MTKKTFKIKKSKSSGDPIRKVGKDTRKATKQTNMVTKGMHGEAFTGLSNSSSKKKTTVNKPKNTKPRKIQSTF